jgi:hypothetical protein
MIFLLRMKSKTSNQEWILLIHQLPPHPTNLRVRIWRKLQRLGAVAIKNSVYILPFNEKTHEDFQWLKQEIESSSGEATVFRAGAVEGATNAELCTAFRKARDEEYAQITAELDGLTGAIREQKRGGHLSAGRVGAHEVTRLCASRKAATIDWRDQARRKARRPTWRSTRGGSGSRAATCSLIAWPRSGSSSDLLISGPASLSSPRGRVSKAGSASTCTEGSSRTGAKTAPSRP